MEGWVVGLGVGAVVILEDVHVFLVPNHAALAAVDLDAAVIASARREARGFKRC